ncbi:MerR family transcriptional regulator [Litchfieldia salsa]|uniref:DNA-binding transcriptional regulator, MerR family n=1 Tax=Litchfieldia salsa TaxID=930152 RepID=A0A1H0WG50_9BACI|nr:MerR family transcriptional regulator [Litchfieldia salsa]SDP89543.1 DNA-binding transcriptional regulator, MerR family [Litchfieldia salsa]
MVSEYGKYNIKAITKMLGIQAGTLRAWERRYKIIAPKRNESGHRLYTEEHVQVLKWLIDKVNKGFTISQAVALIETSKFTTSPISSEQVEEYSLALQNELLESLISFDEHQAQELMNKAFSLYSIDKVVIEILGTLLVQIGNLWEEGKITSAHERFASSFLRSRIGMILHSLPVNGMLPKVVSVCGPGEMHELGLLIFTLYLRRKGFEVIYIGTGIADGDLEIVLEEIHPKFLFVSCTMEKNVDETIKLVERIATNFNDLSIGLGGSAFHNNEKNLTPYDSLIIGENQHQWDQWLKERLSQLK